MWYTCEYYDYDPRSIIGKTLLGYVKYRQIMNTQSFIETRKLLILKLGVCTIDSIYTWWQCSNILTRSLYKVMERGRPLATVR